MEKEPISIQRLSPKQLTELVAMYDSVDESSDTLFKSDFVSKSGIKDRVFELWNNNPKFPLYDILVETCRLYEREIQRAWENNDIPKSQRNKEHQNIHEIFRYLIARTEHAGNVFPGKPVDETPSRDTINIDTGFVLDGMVIPPPYRASMDAGDLTAQINESGEKIINKTLNRPVGYDISEEDKEEKPN